jgi:hypothetical protein
VILMAAPTPPKTKPAAAVAGSDVAPFIFADGSYSWGVNNGSIQIELGANTLVPIQGQDKVATRIVCTGHLRLTPTAALQLRDQLAKALERFDVPAAGEGSRKQ